MKSSPWIALSLGCLLIIAAIVAFSFLIYRGENSGSLTIKLPEGHAVEMKIQKNKVGLLEIFDKIFAEDGQKTKIVTALLRDKEFYKIGDPLLIVTIEKTDGNNELAKEFRTMLKDERGPFRRTYHSFYDINDDSIIDAIVHLDYHHETSKGLRDLLSKSQGPFQDFTEEVIITEGAVEKGSAAVCSSTKFFRNNLIISNESQKRTINVGAFHPHPCPQNGHRGETSGLPIIRIHKEDAYNLFGKS